MRHRRQVAVQASAVAHPESTAVLSVVRLPQPHARHLQVVQQFPVRSPLVAQDRLRFLALQDRPQVRVPQQLQPVPLPLQPVPQHQPQVRVPLPLLPVAPVPYNVRLHPVRTVAVRIAAAVAAVRIAAVHTVEVAVAAVPIQEAAAVVVIQEEVSPAAVVAPVEVTPVAVAEAVEAVQEDADKIKKVVA